MTGRSVPEAVAGSGTDPVVPRHAIVVCQSASFYANEDSAGGPTGLKRTLYYGNEIGHTPGAHPVDNGWAASFDFGPNDRGYLRHECIGGYDSWWTPSSVAVAVAPTGASAANGTIGVRPLRPHPAGLRLRLRLRRHEPARLGAGRPVLLTRERQPRPLRSAHRHDGRERHGHLGRRAGWRELRAESTDPDEAWRTVAGLRAALTG